MAKIEFVTYDMAQRLPFDSQVIPNKVKLSKLFRGDAKVYSKTGGSDGDLALERFLAGFSTWTQENFCTLVPARDAQQAYIHIKSSVDDAFMEIDD